MIVDKADLPPHTLTFNDICDRLFETTCGLEELKETLTPIAMTATPTASISMKLP